MDQGESDLAAAPASSDVRRLRPRAIDIVLMVAAVLLWVPFASRLVGGEFGPLVYAVAFIPWLTAAAAALLAVALVCRAWGAVALAAVPVALGVSWAVPLFTSSDAEAEPVLMVATVNATFGRVDADAVVAMVREHGVDVLAVEELTPDAVEGLAAAGLDSVMPYSETAAEPGVTGTGLWSTLPLEHAESLTGWTDASLTHGYVSRAVQATVDVQGTAVTVLAVHPAAPGPFDSALWAASMEGLTSHLSAQAGPVLVMGDFNTTRDHAAFRAIEAVGYTDAADEAGSGFAPTFPEGRGPFPLVAIDHVLARDLPWVAASTTTVAVAGADHRALVVAYSAPAGA